MFSRHPLGVSTGGGYPKSHVYRGGIPWDLEYSPPPDIPTPSSGHTHPLIVTPGGHHMRHTHPPPPHGQTDTCENITFLQLRLRVVKIADSKLIVAGIPNLVQQGHRQQVVSWTTGGPTSGGSRIFLRGAPTPSEIIF